MASVADMQQKPVMQLPDIAALRELRERAQWVAWKYITRNGRVTKPPVNPHTGEGASHSDSRTWGTYEQALQCAQARGLAGVGYVITEDDGFTGADLDKCRDPDFGHIEPWAQEIIDLAETYAEVSPSGTGLRLIWRGKVEQTFKCDPKNVEVYKSLRYLTITGEHVAGTPTEIRPAPRTESFLRERVEGFRREQEAARAATRPEPMGVPMQLSPRPGVLHSGPGVINPFFRNLNDAAMRDIAAWVPALFGSAAVFQPTTRGFRVSSHSLGRDLEEDLSITPMGIVDFGVHDMGDPKQGKRTPLDIVLEFGGKPTAKEAGLWLCDQIGKDPHDLGWSNTVTEFPALFGGMAVPSAERTGGNLILSSKQFIDGFVPPEYLIDGMVQQGYLYGLTGRTGHGKTAVCMYLMERIARGIAVRDRIVKQGSVLYLAGENPDDIRARYLVLADASGFDPATVPIHFIAGVIDIAAELPRIYEEALQIPDLALVIVDTAAAYFKGDDGNSNTQMGEYARLLRQFTFLPGKPAVIVPSHPVKNASKDNLLPVGGGAFLNELDGNLTLWSNAEKQTTLHWGGKFRGPEFEPLAFRLETRDSDRVVNAAGELMPSVVAVPISDFELEAGEAAQETEENILLGVIGMNPKASIAVLANKARFVNEVGQPLKSKVFRIISRLLEDKLIHRHRGGKYNLTAKGKRELGWDDHD
jgi:hypothetical protein